MQFIRRYSNISFILCVLIVVFVRLNYHQNNHKNGYNATTWDALGYYIYLPSTFIYNDVSELNWFAELDEKYDLSSGDFYQANKISEERHVFKYLGGVAILQSPFFMVAHVYAKLSDYPADGFSAPYQYAIIWGAIIWFLFGLWVLKVCLRKFFNERVTAIVILLLLGASNLIQYVSLDGAMSHAFIFPLYSFLLWLTIKWHEHFKLKYIFLIGIVIGIATISRPTELIMIFIPLLWGCQSFGDFKNKITFIFKEYQQFLLLFFGGILGVLPQIIYWKIASGDWIYNVGSKWYFFNPWWRVLFGFEKGWFIYTPIAFFMIIGLLFIKGRVFQKSVTVFILLNIWIIISWSDWRYGASYSTRALTHSYPVFVFALAGLVNYIWKSKLKWVFGFIGVYLIATNLFQVWQYNAGIIHYNDMNRKYYAAVYWKSNPSPLDYSLLDTDFRLSSEQLEGLNISKEIYFDSSNIVLPPFKDLILAHFTINTENILKNKIKINAQKGYNKGVINISSYKGDSTIQAENFRLSLPFYKNKSSNVYENNFLIKPEVDSVIVCLKPFGKMNLKNISCKSAIGS